MELAVQTSELQQGRPALDFRDAATGLLLKVVLPAGNGYDRIEEIEFTGTAEEREAQFAEWKRANGYASPNPES